MGFTTKLRSSVRFLGSLVPVARANDASEPESQPLAALETSLESLADKGTAFRQLIKDKIEALKPEAK